jgi:copper homeostasis protein
LLDPGVEILFIIKREIEIIQHDIPHFKNLGAHGVVIGWLNDSGWNDEEGMLTLLDAAAKRLDLTFHMGFDQITCEYQFDEIDWLVKHRVQRILTHGGLSINRKQPC